MSAPTLPRIPADASDDLVYRIYRETRDQTPADQRVTCPIHLNWRDRCAHLHTQAA
ncbi:hypothetical protein SUDANB1_07149 [Streptomyces sp. enrichment culture]|uniref:hypothetical protein n=1 Tax=Streptomyces sp. enrichment culture TaxID=1795815 RepID=UPI003F570946